MPYTLEQARREVREDVIRDLTVEETLEIARRLPPEKRLEGIPTEKRLEGLSPGDLLKALPSDKLEELRRLMGEK